MNGIRNIIAELDRLGLSMDFLTEYDRNSILATTNSRVKDVLRARVVDVRWKKKSSGAAGILLDPIYSSNPNPDSYFVNESTSGIWSWMFLEGKGKGSWLEDLQKRNGNEPWPNKANDDNMIDPRYLSINPKTNTIISVPLLFGEFTDTIWGAYTVEWDEYDQPDQDTWNQLESLALSIARIVWKTDTHMIDQVHTKNAIDLYREAIGSEGATAVLNPVRSGFFVRPFREQFKVVEEIIVRYLNKRKIEAQRFENPVSGQVVISDIIGRIRTSHFGIVDITGLNPNVLLECGMLVGLNRHVLFLKSSEDQQTDTSADLAEPFNIQPFEIHQYKVHREAAGAEAQLQFWDPGSNSFAPAERALDRFVESLLKNQEFRRAAEWTP